MKGTDVLHAKSFFYKHWPRNKASVIQSFESMLQQQDTVQNTAQGKTSCCGSSEDAAINAPWLFAYRLRKPMMTHISMLSHLYTEGCCSSAVDLPGPTDILS